MSDTEDPFANLSREDLLQLVRRDQFVKDQLGARVGALFKENIELLGVIQQLQADRASPNGEVTTPVESPDLVS